MKNVFYLVGGALVADINDTLNPNGQDYLLFNLKTKLMISLIYGVCFIVSTVALGIARANMQYYETASYL